MIKFLRPCFVLTYMCVVCVHICVCVCVCVCVYVCVYVCVCVRTPSTIALFSQSQNLQAKHFSFDYVWSWRSVLLCWGIESRLPLSVWDGRGHHSTGMADVQNRTEDHCTDTNQFHHARAYSHMPGWARHLPIFSLWREGQLLERFAEACSVHRKRVSPGQVLDLC